MICIICRQAEFINDFTTITFERDEFKLIINKIPAQVCPNCGEAIVNEDVALQLLSKAQASLAEGMIEDVFDY
jgi:YgiT-type zinc finger domain-containing protein